MKQFDPILGEYVDPETPPPQPQATYKNKYKNKYIPRDSSTLTLHLSKKDQDTITGTITGLKAETEIILEKSRKALKSENLKDALIELARTYSRHSDTYLYLIKKITGMQPK